MMGNQSSKNKQIEKNVNNKPLVGMDENDVIDIKLIDCGNYYLIPSDVKQYSKPKHTIPKHNAFVC